MKQQLWALVALLPLTGHALPKQQPHRRGKCGGGGGGKGAASSVVAPTTTVTTGLPLSDYSSVSFVPAESLPTFAYPTDSLSVLAPTTTATAGLLLSDFPTFSVVPVESLPSITYTTYSTATNTDTPGPGHVSSDSEASPSSSSGGGSRVPGAGQSGPFSFPPKPSSWGPGPSSGPYSWPSYPSSRASGVAAPSGHFSFPPKPSSSSSSSSSSSNTSSSSNSSSRVSSSQPPTATQQCGNSDRLVLPGKPWTVANSMYNADQMVGQQCTNFEDVTRGSDGAEQVEYTSVTNIEKVDETKDVCKGYSNIGIGTNLNQKFSDVVAIPAYFQWNQTNSTEFRGSNIFDFVVSPTQGDTTSTKTSEFMLWVRNWGNQVPIGYADGPVAAINLYDAHWTVYEGKNPTSGVTVRSMVANDNYDGEFRGDLKQWLNAMLTKGYFSADEYVTTGNAGTEVFYGNSTMHARVALNINV